MLNRVLITGSTGLIGRALIPVLLERGFNVRAQVRDLPRARAQFSNEKYFHRIEFIECDFARSADNDFNGLVRECSTVIHLAGLVHQPDALYQDYELLNVRATEQLIKAAKFSNVRTFLLFSTSAVYGSGPFVMIDENTPLKADTPYAVSKKLCENLAQNTAEFERVVSLRPALVFGVGDRGNLIKLIQSIKKKRFVYIGNGETTKSLIYAKDLALGVALCLEKLPIGQHTLNIANPKQVSLKELAKEISLALGQSEFIPTIPAGLLKAGTLIADKLMPGVLPISTEQLNKLSTSTTLCVERLVKATDFQPRYSLATALKEEIDWARQAGLL